MQAIPAQALNPPNPPPAAVSGGPGMSMEASPPQPAGAAPINPPASGQTTAGTTGGVTPGSPAAPTEQRPIIIGDRLFTDMGEAMAYANDLARNRPAQVVTAEPPAVHGGPVDPADLIFEDPKAAVRMIKDQAKSELRSEIDQQNTTAAIWKGFYEQHPDLIGHEDLVHLQQAKHWNTIKDVKISQSLPFIAGEARKQISKIRQSAKTGEELPPGPAIVLGSSGPTPPAQLQPKPQVMTFIDECKALRRRKA